MCKDEMDGNSTLEIDEEVEKTDLHQRIYIPTTQATNQSQNQSFLFINQLLLLPSDY
jgi:hypothetical protein